MILGTILAAIDLALSSVLLYLAYSAPGDTGVYIILLMLLQGPGLIIGYPLAWLLARLWLAPPPVGEPVTYLLVLLCGVLSWFACGYGLERFIRSFGGRRPAGRSKPDLERAMPYLLRYPRRPKGRGGRAA